ncbi:MAG TPA: type II secretion system protein GspM, partial [Bacillota bacterium]|nr:type II secretion system protein GspM [Bacillota bacterium]
MTKSFTSREKFLLLVLAVIVVVAAYYMLIHRPISESLESIASQKEAAETEIVILQAKAAQLSSMKKELEEIERSGSKSYVPLYDNLSAEMSFLSSVLQDSTYDYTLNFTGTTEKDGVVRRGVQIHFSTENYSVACRIIEKLQNSEFCCRIGDVTMVPLRDNVHGTYYNYDA